MSRDEIFRRWIAQVFVDLKAKKITREEAASCGGISRNQTYQWEGRGKKGYSRPTADKLKAFCIGNGLDWHVPFRIFGWNTSAAGQQEQGLDAKIRRLEVRLSQSPPADERRELEIALVAARRMRDSGAAMIDEVLEKYKAG